MHRIQIRCALILDTARSIRIYLLASILCVLASGASAQYWDVRGLSVQYASSPEQFLIPLRSGNLVEYAQVGHVRNLLVVFDRLKAASGISANLILLARPELNAYAVADPPTVGIPSGMLRLTGSDEGMLAAVVAHELAHIGLKHHSRRSKRQVRHEQLGVAVGRRVAGQSGDVSAGVEAAVVTTILLDAAYGRQQEVEADKLGVELLSRAKFDPDGMIRLFRAMVARIGMRQTGYFDSHPGLEDRILEAEPTVMDEHFRVLAEALYQQENWKRLLRATEYWLKANPESARAWYYRGAGLKGEGLPGALDAFERAASIDPSLQSARLGQCIELYRARRHEDSLYCSEHLSLNENKDTFEGHTFGHPTFVHGLSKPPSVDQDRISIIRD